MRFELVTSMFQSKPSDLNAIVYRIEFSNQIFLFGAKMYIKQYIVYSIYFNLRFCQKIQYNFLIFLTKAHGHQELV